MINLSIPKPLLSALDQQAKNEVKTRSQLLRDAISSYLQTRILLNNVYEAGRKQAKKLKLKPSDVERLIDEYRQGK